MKIEIKTAQESDLPKIAYLFNDYRIFYKQVSDYDKAYQFLRERFEQSESVVFYVHDENNNCLGFTQLFPGFSSVSVQRTWILNDLYVSKQYRGQGIGTLLLNRAKTYAIETHTKGIALETSLDNVNAQKLYESLGYIKDTELSYFLAV